jgi:outer membrane biosynthesis protein TonB
MTRAVLGLMLPLLALGGCAAESREASRLEQAPALAPEAPQDPAGTPEPGSADAPDPASENTPEPEDAAEPEGASALSGKPGSTGGYTIYGQPRTPKPRPSGELPQVVVSEAEVGTPAIPAEVIRRVVRSHLEALRACYALGLAQDPALAGRIAISFTIGPSGAVVDAKAETPDAFPYPEVPKCIADELRTWTFPAPRGGGMVHVSYPFNLLPSG